ncbi:TPA: hypothetical protein MCI55_005215 [Klebsiella pneumoniae]|nr:hypothetical protein [Klebsiella pneumoniae]
MGEISVKTGNNARNGGKNSLNRLIRCVCGKKIGPDPRNFNQRVSLGRNDLLIRTFLSKLMDLVGAKGTSARVLALNDYTTIIPIDDFYKFPVIMALKMNGQYMRIRDKGPLFIVYPYDSSAELQNQIYYSRSAWQVSKMIIE